MNFHLWELNFNHFGYFCLLIVYSFLNGINTLQWYQYIQGRQNKGGHPLCPFARKRQRKVPSMSKSDLIVTNIAISVNKSALSVQKSAIFSLKKCPFSPKSGLSVQKSALTVQKEPLQFKKVAFQSVVKCPVEDFPSCPSDLPAPLHRTWPSNYIPLVLCYLKTCWYTMWSCDMV